jgi:hypothetical protein
MSYEYTKAGNLINSKTPQDNYIDLFQETLNNQFDNASNVWTIQEEYPDYSKSYTNTQVRISHVINAETGLKLGDDWKTLYFKDLNHPIQVGKLYYFDENVWITINTEIIKNLGATATIKRCNNVLKWIDAKTGAMYEEPCSLEYLVKEPRDYTNSGAAMIVPGGFVNIRAQFNERTNIIRANQRFMFGNAENKADSWVCFRILATGKNTFMNLKTYDNMSTGVIVLDAIANYVNDETDDIVNGIADLYSNQYEVLLNKTSISAEVGTTYQLTSEVRQEGETITRDVEWVSSNIKIATVSNAGLVTMVSSGTVGITAKIVDNPTSALCTVTITENPTTITDILISPNKNYVLESDNRTYEVYLYKNNTKQADTFTITCNPNTIPLTSFTFEQIDGNSFKITNTLKNLESYLTITFVSGTNEKTMNIYLRGAW